MQIKKKKLVTVFLNGKRITCWRTDKWKTYFIGKRMEYSLAKCKTPFMIELKTMVVSKASTETRSFAMIANSK